uniref:Uncharacterized protein n=1 Tax=Anguilla anguilla TaxID=7936 RepID=A0A0E9PVI0_ANGAN
MLTELRLWHFTCTRSPAAEHLTSGYFTPYSSHSTTGQS